MKKLLVIILSFMSADACAREQATQTQCAQALDSLTFHVTEYRPELDASYLKRVKDIISGSTDNVTTLSPTPLSQDLAAANLDYCRENGITKQHVQIIRTLIERKSTAPYDDVVKCKAGYKLHLLQTKKHNAGLAKAHSEYENNFSTAINILNAFYKTTNPISENDLESLSAALVRKSIEDNGAVVTTASAITPCKNIGIPLSEMSDELFEAATRKH